MNDNPHGVTGQRALSAAFAEFNRGTRRARVAHEITKADHALPFGCEVCGRGAASLREPEWNLDYGLLFCPDCKGHLRATRMVADLRAREAV